MAVIPQFLWLLFSHSPRGQADRQTDVTSGPEVADGEQGDGLGLAMLYPDPAVGVLSSALTPAGASLALA